MKDWIKYALLGGAAYFVYRNYFSVPDSAAPAGSSGAAAAGSTQTDTHPILPVPIASVDPAAVANSNQRILADLATQGYAVLDWQAGQVPNSAQGLAASDPTKADLTGGFLLNWYQWNWFRERQAPDKPRYASEDLGVDPNQLITAKQFHGFMQAKGLEGLGATNRQHWRRAAVTFVPSPALTGNLKPWEMMDRSGSSRINWSNRGFRPRRVAQ